MTAKKASPKDLAEKNCCEELARRVAELEARQADQERMRKVQSALYEIAEAASAVRDMGSFYKKLHKIVGKLMYAKNFFIALYDEHRDLITWPYYADTVDIGPVPPARLSDHHGATGWVLRHGQTLADADGGASAAMARGELMLVGSASEGIGVPLKIKGKAVGVIVVQSYIKGVGYQMEDVKVLEFIAQHITTALTRARALEAERQRTEELAQSNKIQTALYKIADAASASHDMQEFYAAIHRIVGELMYAENFFVALYEAQNDLITWPYYVDTVDVEKPAPTRLKDQHGGTAWVLQHGKSLATADGSVSAALERGEAEQVGPVSDGIVVPLNSGGQTIGVLLIQSYIEAIKYTLQDIQVLTFVAQHIATALTRARAIEAERQRTEELAIITSVQTALASKLDFQGIVDSVGDKLAEIFPAENVGIGFLDKASRIFKVPYLFENGKRVEPFEMDMNKGGLMAYTFKTRQPLVINSDFSQRTEEIGLAHFPGEGPVDPKSWLSVPIFSGDEVMGGISLRNWQRENAFSESDVRLLQTLSNSMSVALENARLFDETQRLLKETEQRNAELAIITSVQQGLASKLDYQTIIELVGMKVNEIFNADTTYVALLEAQTQLFEFPYYVDKGHPLEPSALPLGRGLTSRVLETGQPLLLNTREEQRKQDVAFGAYQSETEDLNETYLGVPILLGNSLSGVISVQKYRQYAYDESHLRLLQTLANSMSVALENARLFDEVQKSSAQISEALEQQTASNDILRVIAESPTNIQPVLDVIVHSAALLSGSDDAIISMADNGTLRIDAHYGDLPMLPVGESVPLNRDSVAGRAIIDGQSLQAVHNQRGKKSGYPLGDKVAK